MSPFRKAIFIFLTTLTISFLVSYSFLFHRQMQKLVYAQPFFGERDVESDNLCYKQWPGTMTKETCVAGCPTGPLDCSRVGTLKSEDYSELEEDLECFGCDARYSCYDLGYIYNTDCPPCNLNPNTRCSSTFALGIAVPGGPPSLPKDSSGNQCWQCQNIPDTCFKHWPGSSLKAACEAGCKRKDHKCVKVGKNPDDGRDCYKCQHFPPPAKCADMGFRYAAQCGTCPANKPNCGPVNLPFFGPLKDGTGQACFDCYPRPLTCEQQGLHSACLPDEIPVPVVAPNGANCFDCKQKPDTCADYLMKDQPCQCGPRERVFKLNLPNGVGGRMPCCDCIKNPCIPDLAAWECKECLKKGGQCQSITRERGKPPCYRCVMPPKDPTNCREFNMAASCTPNPCQEGETCRMIDPLAPPGSPPEAKGAGFTCAECSLPDTPPPRSQCENHPTHKWSSCAPCFQAQMSCDQKKISDNPEVWCAKCLEPPDRRCPDGTIEGSCGGIRACVDGLKCIDVGEGCHQCIDPEACAPGRYRLPNCDGKCQEGKETCQRIEGCEDGTDPRDVARIEQIDPNQKYCGPDITSVLLESIQRIQNRVNKLPDSAKGAIDGTMFLDKNGMSIDLRVVSVQKTDGTQVCPSKPCMSGDGQKTINLCGHCVMEHIANDILFGFVSNQLDVPFSIQLAGAHYAEYTSYGGLDPLASQGAYKMGNDLSEAMKERKINVGDLCSIVNATTLKTGVFKKPLAFDLMGKEKDFLKDCRPCPFGKTRVLKDFSKGDWKLGKGSYDRYPQTIKQEIYECCYACRPVPAQPPPECVDSTPGGCLPNPCSQGYSCLPVGDGCHTCTPNSCEDEGFYPPKGCPQGQECLPLSTFAGVECCECATKTSLPPRQPPPPQCDAQSGQSTDSNCGGTCDSNQECQPVSGKEGCFQCVEKKRRCQDIDSKLYYHSDCTPWCSSQGYGQCRPTIKDEHGIRCYECISGELTSTCQEEGWQPGICPGTCKGGQKCIPHSVQHNSRLSDDVVRGNCHECITEDYICEEEGYKSSCPSGQECVPVTTKDGLPCCDCKSQTIPPEDPPPPQCDLEKGEYSDSDCSNRCQSNERCEPSGTSGSSADLDRKKARLNQLNEQIRNSQRALDNPPSNVKGEYLDTYKAGLQGGIREATTERDALQREIQQLEGQAKEGSPCYKCVPITTQPPQCDPEKGEIPGGCPANCPFGQTCVPVGENCHTCSSISIPLCVEFAGEWSDPNCGGVCTGNLECKPSPRTQGCYSCAEKPSGVPPICDLEIGEYSDSNCAGICAPNAQCAPSIFSPGCYTCQPKDISGLICTPEGRYATHFCDEQCLPHEICVPESEARQRFGMGRGALPHGQQPPIFQDGLGTGNNQQPPVEPIFSDGFESGDTSAWTDSYTCRDWMHETFTPLGDGAQCFVCVPRRMPYRIRYIEVTYVIIVVETPFGRFVLKDGDREGVFKPESVMALAKVDPSTGKIFDVAGNLRDLKSFAGGGMNPLGLMSMNPMNLQQFGQQLTESLGSRGSFGDDCFEDFTEGEGKGKKGKKAKKKSSKRDDASAGNTAGSVSSSQKQTPPPGITGPVVSCGTNEGQKTLNIYDASGALVKSITKKELKSNPNAVFHGLQKAEVLSQRFASLRRPNLDALFERFTGVPVGNVKQMFSMAKQQEAPGKKKKKLKKGQRAATDFSPNDPFYQFSKKKKKKLLGILGGGAGAAFKIGGGASVGGGLSVGGERKPKSEVKDQYGLRQIGFTPTTDPNSAWNVIDVNQRNVVVAVIDSGFDFEHRDAPQFVWTNPNETPGNGIDDDQNGYVDDIHGWNFLNENHDFRDYRGHGTFVAGIIAAKTNNGFGIAGINPGALIMPLKVANEEGETNSFDIYRAINYAVTHGARIINISLGARGLSPMEHAAVRRAHELGALVVISAGNSGEDIMTFGPASSYYAMAVGASNVEGDRSVVSNQGPNHALMAPGEEIYSLASKNNKHVTKSIKKNVGVYTQSGTSFSAPMVTATASLLLAKNPKLNNIQLMDILMGTAQDVKREGWDHLTGAGILNAAAVLRATEGAKYLTMMFTGIEYNRSKAKRIESMDVFALIRGDLAEYTLEVGKGKRAKKFKQVAGPFKKESDYGWIAQINVKEHMRGSKEWILRINAKTKSGQHKVASILVELK